MSKHKDYTKFSNREQREEKKLIEEAQTTVDKTEFAPKNVEETVPESKQGVVTDCLKLNIRKEPNPEGEVIGTIDASNKLEVYENESTDEFYKICTYSGVEGYCMKKFITILF